MNDRETHEETAEEKAEFVMNQLREIKNSRPKVTCNCGTLIYWFNAFRCLYCGEFYCQSCAEEHFGKTRKEWIECDSGNAELDRALLDAKL